MYEQAERLSDAFIEAMVDDLSVWMRRYKVIYGVEDSMHMWCSL